MADDHIKQQLKTLCPPIDGVDIESLTLTEDFLDLCARFAHQPGSVVLYSGGDLDCARYHLLGLWPWLTLCTGPDHTDVATQTQQISVTADPITVLGATLRYFRLPHADLPGPMAAGLMGYLAYDLKDSLETLPRTSVDELGLPLMMLFAPSVLVIHDKLAGTTQLMVPRRNGHGPGTEALIRRFKNGLAKPQPPETKFSIDAHQMQSNFDQPAYHTAVQRIIDYIAAGDVYQVNMSQRFQAPFQGNGFQLFRHLVDLNPAPFFAYVQGPDHEIISTSPERFICQQGREVEARPIKGTRPRCSDPTEDAAMRRELETSPKDEAELAMIVDLLRNDLGKVCQAGSVKVREHKRIEAYDNVYHLVSIVDGELDPDVSPADVIRAGFPGGSITGCPKVRAMEIIDELETCRRHVYCGSIGYISFHDTMDLSIAIRTATVINDTIRFSVGGAIVFDSQPQQEYEETLHKGRTLMAACQESGNGPGLEPSVWLNGSMTTNRAAQISTNDLGLLYGFGFFETIRVDRGKAPLLKSHLARFNNTWRALMPNAPPDLSWKDIIDQVIRTNELHDRCVAVKLLATRGSRSRAPWDNSLLVTARAYVHRLNGKSALGLKLGTYPHPRQSPLARYKTLNYLYYYQAAQWAADAGYDEALILNPDGSISETNTANLLLINGRKVIRPTSPAVLPGVMAEAVCRLLATWGYRIIEQCATTEMLLAADTALITNALIGCVPLLGVDGKSRPVGSELWRRINDAILEDWRRDL